MAVARTVTLRGVEPVEINAGEYYLRQLRADAAIDDRAALVAAFADPETARWVRTRIPDLDTAGEYVHLRADQWKTDTRYSWAVAEQTTGALLAEIDLKDVQQDHGTAEAGCWTHPDHRGRGIATEALRAVLRFGFGGLGLHHVSYRHSAGNSASQRVAEKCGFRYEGRLREAALVDDNREDLLIWSRLATDPAE